MMHKLIEVLQSIEHASHAAKPAIVAAFLAILTLWELGHFLWRAIVGGE